MFVPTARLIFWTAAVVLPFAVIAGTIPSALSVACAIIGIFLVCAILDAALAPGGQRDLRIELPSLVRLQKGRAGSLEIRIQNSSSLARVLRLGLPFPPELTSDSSERLVPLPAGSAQNRITWPCVGLERGQFFLRAVHLETRSRLGFWAHRRALPAHSEIRVYPDLLAERHNVAALFLRRPEFGIHAQRLAGQGREFEKLRDFVAGDSIADIHWKATAKRGRPVTKVHQIERSHEVYVIIDASRLAARKVPAPLPVASQFTSTPPPVPQDTPALERYVTGALVLAVAAERQGDQFGLLTFSDRVLSFVRARNGQTHFDACRDRLYALQPQDVSPDFEDLSTFIRLRLRKRALLIFLTALDDPVLSQSFVKAVELVSRQHLVLVNMLRPRGVAPLFTSSEPVSKVDDLYGKLAGHFQWHNLRELQKVLQRRGALLSFLNSETLAADLVAQHGEIRARQLL